MGERPDQIELVLAAARLSIGYHVAHRMVLTGELRGERLGRRWMVDRRDLERLLRERGSGRSILARSAAVSS
jgi:hypothetical protein